MEPTALAFRLLDLYCCAGGAGAGYAAAGFDVTGVDKVRHARNPHPVIEADVLELPLDFIRRFDAVHASPPCQFGTKLRHAKGTRKDHQNLIPGTRDLLERAGVPYIIENVESKDVWPFMEGAITLCGTMFGLGATADRFYELQRHRLFQANFPISAPGPCRHRHPVIGMYGGHVRNRGAGSGGRGTADFVGYDRPALAREAMGIDWMTMGQMSEAIPPAYTLHLGRQLLDHLCAQRAAAPDLLAL